MIFDSSAILLSDPYLCSKIGTKMKLSEIAILVEDKISSNSISLGDYVTTDSLLPNKEGKTIATNLPPVACSLTRYQKGDVLVANIRPYLKKVWLADKEGGCSSDVLVFRVREGYKNSFLYAVLLQDRFFDYATRGAKGSKMPRGDKEQIMRYELPVFSPQEQENIGNIVINITEKLQLNRAINHNLEAMAKQLYDYWFVQFDFPDAEGKPYKSSGGKMVYNDKLKREIPEGWECGSLLDIATFTNGLACQKHRPSNIDHSLPIIKIREMRTGTDNDSERVSSEIPESVKVYNGDILFSWSASLEVMLWAGGNGGLNQHIFKVTSANEFPKSFYFYQVLNYVSVFKQMAEARKTTMGHITQEHLMQSVIAIPKNKSITALFEDKLEPIFNQIIVKQESIQNLIKLRNELLPLLINGQVSVGAVNYDLSHD